MASASATSFETSNPRLLQERMEYGREEILRLEQLMAEYSSVADTIAELPKKLQHHVMVPIGKRAMMPGRIVRSNEVLAHLGDDYFAWMSATNAVNVIDRKVAIISKQINAEEAALNGLQEKQQEVDKLFDIKKLYEEENIRDIQETEEESERHPIARVTEQDVEEYFEIEEDERRRNEQTVWDWEDAMKRMEELEAMEERDFDKETKEVEPRKTNAERATEYKAMGNAAFGARRFTESIEHYSKAIEYDPQSHILYGNRAAAFHRTKKYEDALADALRSVELDDSWVKGHYRVATAYAALSKYEQAASAFDRAFDLCPTDPKLKQQAEEMRAKVSSRTQEHQGSFASTAMQQQRSDPTGSALPPVPVINTVSEKVFSGSIVERGGVDKPEGDAIGNFQPRRPRFTGNNPGGDVVTLEPTGDAQPVKRVSRFKAQRAGN